MTKDIVPRLFGTDGIRARYGSEPFTPDSLKRLGASLAKVLDNPEPFSRYGQAPKRLFIGRDTRWSCPEILENLAAGFADSSIELYDLGVITTPGVAFCVRAFGALSGLMISASHNPAEDNGLKLFGPDGFKFPDQKEKAIEEIFSELTPPDSRHFNLQAASTHVQHYQDYLLNYAREESSQEKPFQGLTFVLDCAHGSSYEIAPQLFQALGAQIIPLASAPDGKNINQNCGALYPENLREHIVKHQANAGISFDGDGDRLILTDEKGQVLDGDFILAILAQKLQDEGKLLQNQVVTTLMANIGLEHSLEAKGIQLKRTAVGDRFVTEEMLRSGLVLGGEQSGHIIHFERGMTTGDAIFNALTLLLYVFDSKKEKLSNYAQIIERAPQVLLNCSVPQKPKLEELPETQAEKVRIEKKLNKKGRVILRYSGTEALLRVMIEGPEYELVHDLAQKLAQVAEAEIKAFK